MPSWPNRSWWTRPEPFGVLAENLEPISSQFHRSRCGSANSLRWRAAKPVQNATRWRDRNQNARVMRRFVRDGDRKKCKTDRTPTFSRNYAGGSQPRRPPLSNLRCARKSTGFTGASVTRPSPLRRRKSLNPCRRGRGAKTWRQRSTAALRAEPPAPPTHAGEASGSASVTTWPGLTCRVLPLPSRRTVAGTNRLS